MLQKICSFILFKLLGWKVEGEVPTHNKYRRLLLIYVPHTSNWDFVIGMLFLGALKIRATVFGKDQFYFPPISWGYDLLNIVPIKRGQKNNFVNTAAALYDNDAALWTGMAPEGTRSKVDSVKSGYYYFAKKAGIPVLTAGLDFSRKVLRLGSAREVKESFEEDQAELIAFASRIQGKRPHLAVGYEQKGE